MEIQTNEQIEQPAKNKRYKKIKNTVIIILVVILLGFSIRFGIKFYEIYNNPTLIGEWISEETGKTIEFVDNGQVLVDYMEVGSYIITTPNKMEYTTQGQTFNMHYKLEQRSLIWGIDEEEYERFERKQQWFDLGLDISS